MNNHEIESNLENEDPRVICRTRDRGVVVCIGETAGDPQSLQNAFKGWKKSKQKAEKVCKQQKYIKFFSMGEFK